MLADWRTAPLDERLRATLGFLEKVTLSPGDLVPEDVAPLRAAGLSDQAIREALYICFIFNVMDRLADAFDFYLPSAQGIRRNGRIAFALGYRMTSVPG